MRYVDLYADPSGESHFKTGTIELNEADDRPPAPLMFVSHAYPTNALQFIRLPKGWAGQDSHPPHQQFLLCLEGQIEITASDGEKRTFGPGAALLMQDTAGKGHRTDVKGPHDWVAAVIPLA